MSPAPTTAHHGAEDRLEPIGLLD